MRTNGDRLYMIPKEAIPHMNYKYKKDYIKPTSYIKQVDNVY